MVESELSVIKGFAMKTCSTCFAEKSFEEFTKREKSKDGLSASCTRCLNKKKRESYASDPEQRQMAKEKAKKNERVRKENDPVFRNAWNAWRYAKSIKRVPKWIKFTRDILPVYKKLIGRKKIGMGHWVVDHIVPLKGKRVSGLHVPNNLHLMPFAENSLKADYFNEKLTSLIGD